MSIPLLLQTAFWLTLSQATVPPNIETTIDASSARIDTSGCQVNWLDRTRFEPMVHLELASICTPEKNCQVTARIVCRSHDATVWISSTLAPMDSPSLKRTISLLDTPDGMRTRTLALAVADAAKDFTEGVLAQSPKADSTVSTQFATGHASVSSLTHNDSENATDNPVHAYPSKRRTILQLSVLSSLSTPHAALSLGWIRCVSKWRFGLEGAGMRFSTSFGQVYSGKAAARLGYTVSNFFTKNENIGELNLNILLGAVHARGLPGSSTMGKKHTRPLAAIEAEFAYYINPHHQIIMGLRIFGGWMLGMSLNVADENIGGFNGFYGGAGWVLLISERVDSTDFVTN